MLRKFLFIGVRPEEVRRVLAKYFERRNAIHFRPNLMEALPDLSKESDICLIFTKLDHLRQAGELFISFNNEFDGSSHQKLLPNGEFPELVGKSEKICEIYRRISQVAATDSTVLIEGESGTGKELVARAIHFNSSRAHNPFIKVNCAALPETLIESELFGHVRGAFTGAVRNHKGRFRQADGGTLLLDEIGAMPLTSQAKFLRVLQEKEFEPVGSSTTVKVNVRVIATHNSDLVRAVQNGAFREDLYYRLSVFPIVVPPLRERQADIALLTEHFLRKYSYLNPNVRGISEEAMQVIMNFKWPGNVRQLENAIQHALIVEKTNMIRPSSLQVCPNTTVPLINNQLPSLRLSEKLNLYEKQLIEEALARSHGKKKIAAELLGVHPKNFSYLLHKHRL